MIVLKRVAVAVYVLFLIHTAGLGIDLAAQQRLLVPYAFPAGIVLILAVRVLGRKAELAGDLPAACILFDVPIGLYLLWFASRGRWDVLTPRWSRPTRALGSGRP
jgi:hypothetical protein